MKNLFSPLSPSDAFLSTIVLAGKTWEAEFLYKLGDNITSWETVPLLHEQAEFLVVLQPLGSELKSQLKSLLKPKSDAEAPKSWSNRIHAILWIGSDSQGVRQVRPLTSTQEPWVGKLHPSLEANGFSSWDPKVVLNDQETQDLLNQWLPQAIQARVAHFEAVFAKNVEGNITLPKDYAKGSKLDIRDCLESVEPLLFRDSSGKITIVQDFYCLNRLCDCVDVNLTVSEVKRHSQHHELELNAVMNMTTQKVKLHENFSGNQKWNAKEWLKRSSQALGYDLTQVLQSRFQLVKKKLAEGQIERA